MPNDVREYFYQLSAKMMAETLKCVNEHYHI